jgi:hypothetical protein
MDPLAGFGLFAVTAMRVCYALERRSPWYEVRGPPQRNSLIIMALSTRGESYEPGGRGFKSCRARQINKGLQAMQPLLFSPAA